MGGVRYSRELVELGKGMTRTVNQEDVKGRDGEFRP